RLLAAHSSPCWYGNDDVVGDASMRETLGTREPAPGCLPATGQVRLSAGPVGGRDAAGVGTGGAFEAVCKLMAHDETPSPLPSCSRTPQFQQCHYSSRPFAATPHEWREYVGC